MKFVVVILAAFNGNGPFTTTVEFETLKACREAEKAWGDESPYGFNIAILPCAPLGEVTLFPGR